MENALQLPGPFTPDVSYLLKGATLNAARTALQRDRAIAGTGLLETGTPQGRILSLDPSATGLNFYLKTVAFGWGTVNISGYDVMVASYIPDLWHLIKFTNGRAVEWWDGPGSPPSYEEGYHVFETSYWRLV